MTAPAGGRLQATALPDTYNRRARLTPGLLALAPVVATVAVAIPSVASWWQKVGIAIVAAGLWLLPAQWIADRGKNCQADLWAAWGGAPTTTALRWSSATNKVSMARLHTDVTKATGIPLPDERVERRDPATADHAYEAAVEVLREATRAKDTFPLVTEEVTNYGFRRNLYGLRPIGITLAALGAAGAAALVFIGAKWGHVSLGWSIAALVGDLAWLLGWWLVITSDWVRPAADRYADRLLAAASQLPKKGR